jgi:integrase
MKSKKPTKDIPSYRYHKARGLAVVTISGRDVYLGPHGTPESKSAYDRTIAEWLANGRIGLSVERDENEITITEMIAAYWRHARTYYVKDGRPTSEQWSIKVLARELRRMYGQEPASAFGPLSLKAVRQVLIDRGHSGKHINDQIARLKLMFKWAASNELVSASVHHGLQTVTGIRRGRSAAAESKPVFPVADEPIDAVKQFLSDQVNTMIELQLLTGMRPGEVVIMRGIDLDMSGQFWQYRPSSHKTSHHGHQRVIDLGPRARDAIRAFFKSDLHAYLFSPAEAEANRRDELRRQRKTPVQPSQRNRRKKRPKRRPLDHYTTDSYRRAIARACDNAFPPPANLSDSERASWRRQHRWHPHQLRHSYATRIRREHGLEAARILLGHRSMAVTEIYAEIDRAKVADIVAKRG